MPRVTRPDSAKPGVGTVPLTRDVSTPFQSFTVPTPDFSGLRAVAKGATDAAAAFAKIQQDEQDKNDKRGMLAFDTASTEQSDDLLLNPETGLATKHGEEALASIRGDGTVVDVGDQTTLKDEYAARLADAKARAGAGMSDPARLDLDLVEKRKLAAFSAAINKAEIEAQAKVDLDLITNRISSAAESAATAVNNPIEDFQLARSRGYLGLAISTSLAQVEAAVRDPDIGLAIQNGVTDPDLVDEMVRKSQGAVYVRVIQQMIVNGDTVGAMTLLDNQTKEGGTLAGTAEAVKLNTSVLATRQSVQGKQIYGAIKLAHPTDKNAQLGMILKIPNINRQALALHEWKADNANQAAVLRENVARETGHLVRWMQANPGVAPNPAHYPALSFAYPRIIFEAAARTRGLAIGARMDAATAAHVAAGGSAVGSDTIVDSLGRMAKEKPAAFVKMMENPENVKPFTTAAQWVQLQSKAIMARKDEIDATTGVVQYDAILKALGFRTTSRKYKNLIQNPKLHEALNKARQDVFDQTGKPASLRDDLMPIIAQYALPVDAPFTTQSTLYHLSDFAKEGTVDHRDMFDTPLDLDKDRDMVAVHYALDRKVSSKEIRNIVDEFDGPVTLRIIAEKVPGGVSILKLDRWEQDRVDYTNAVLEMGYPPEFISAILDIQNGRQGIPHTEANAALVVQQFKVQPDVYKAQFIKWAAGGAL